MIALNLIVHSQRFKFNCLPAFALVLVLSLALQILIGTPAQADSGGIDTSFGNSGSVQVAIGDPGAMISGLAIDANGKIYQSGAQYVNSVWVGAVARLNSDGSIDSQFGTSGFFQDASQTGRFTDVAFHGDLIYVLDRLGRVLRLLPDGQLDTTFADSGVLAFNPSEITGNLSYGTLSVNSSGQIFVSGWGSRTVSGNASYDSFVAAFDSQGLPLTNFGSSGVAYLPRTTDQDLIYDSVIDESGNLFLSGSKSFPNYFWIVKVLPDGILDPTFGIDGEVSSSAPSGYTGGSWDYISLDSNSKILVTGSVTNLAGTDSDIFASRFNSDGTEDFQRRISFGRFEEGQFIQEGRGGIYIAARSAGLVGGTYVDKQHLIRLTDLGAVDTSFGVDGVINRQLGEVHSASMDAYGDLYLSGNVSPSNDKTIVKYAAVSPPSAPLDVSAVASAESIELDWTEPIDDGSRPITDYVIQISTNGSNWKTVNDGTSSISQIDVNNLMPNTIYYFRIFASNSFFTGPSSEPIEIRTELPERPGKPTLSAVPDDLTINLSWAPPVDGGGFLTGYILQRKIGVGSWISIRTTSHLTSEFEDTVTRANAGSIYYRILALNDGGSSEYSNSVSVKVFASPLSPTSITATGGISKIKISWNKPSNYLQTGALTYIFQITNDGLTWVDFTPSNFLPGSNNAVFDSGIIGASYRFRVKALNSVGGSSWSSSSNLSKMGESTLTYNYASDYGSKTKSVTYRDGGPAIELFQPSRRGFKFEGWFVSPSFTGRAIVWPYAPNETQSLHAKWRKLVKAKSEVKPRVSGTSRIGRELRVSLGTWSGYPKPSFTYQWYFCTSVVSSPTSEVPNTCQKISRATRTKLGLSKSYLRRYQGRHVAVLVTGTSPGTSSTSWLTKSKQVK